MPTTPSGAGGRESTREQILSAARRLLAQRHPSALSVGQIANAAGVSHRTVYRYFPSKEALISQIAEHPAVAELMAPTKYADAPGMLRIAWRHLASRLDELRGERAVPGGIELRRARLDASRRAVRAVLADAGIPRNRARKDLVEVITLLTSSSSLLELMDRHGHDVDKAVDLVLDAIERLITSARDAEEP